MREKRVESAADPESEGVNTLSQPNLVGSIQAFVGVGVLARQAELANEIGIDVENAGLGVDGGSIEFELRNVFASNPRNGAFKAEVFAFAKEIAMPPVCFDLGTVDRRQGGRCAEIAGLAFDHLKADRNPAIGIELLPLDDLNALHTRELGDAITGLFQV